MAKAPVDCVDAVPRAAIEVNCTAVINPGRDAVARLIESVVPTKFSGGSIESAMHDTGIGTVGICPDSLPTCVFGTSPEISVGGFVTSVSCTIEGREVMSGMGQFVVTVQPSAIRVAWSALVLVSVGAGATPISPESIENVAKLGRVVSSVEE